MALIGRLAGVTTNALTFLHLNLYLVSMSHMKQHFMANPTSPIFNVMSPSPSKSYRLTLYFVCGRVLREFHDILELSIKSLKKGWNRGCDPSSRKLSIKNSLVARRTLVPIWKLGEIFGTSSFISQFWENLGSKGQFIPWTIELDHGRWPFFMVNFYGSISLVRFRKKTNL